MTPRSQFRGTPWGKFVAERTDVESPPVVVWQLSGNFTDCKDAYAFLDDFRGLMRDGSDPVLVDLGGVEHITSCGAGILAACLASSLNASRKLGFIRLSKRTESVLTVIGLTKTMEIYGDRDEAIRALTV